MTGLELSAVKGGIWMYIDGKWIWVEEKPDRFRSS